MKFQEIYKQLIGTSLHKKEPENNIMIANKKLTYKNIPNKILFSKNALSELATTGLKANLHDIPTVCKYIPIGMCYANFCHQKKEE